MDDTYNKARAVTEQEEDKYSGKVSIDVNTTSGKRAESTVGELNIPYTIEFEYRDWGIKGMTVTMQDTIDLDVVMFGEDGETETPITIKVDLSKLKIEWVGEGQVAPRSLELYIDDKGEVDYDRSSAVFSYIRPLQ